MKNIHLLSFTGGTGGDFLCSEISKDTNFYTLESNWIFDMNRYDLENPFQQWNLDIKDRHIPSLQISDTVFNEIDLYYNEKNLITPTHFFGAVNQIKLPRIKGIKLYTTQLSPLFYSLLWIKRWTAKRYYETKEEFLKLIGSPNPNYIVNVQEIDTLFTNRNYLYSFEIPALKSLHKNAIDFVSNFFVTYSMYSTIPNDNFGWIPYNIDNLYLDPINNSEAFSQIFSMEQAISPAIITAYYTQNLRVIEETFGEPYDVFISNDWLSKLKQWVLLQCPDLYSIDF